MVFFKYKIWIEIEQIILSVNWHWIFIHRLLVLKKHLLFRYYELSLSKFSLKCNTKLVPLPRLWKFSDQMNQYSFSNTYIYQLTHFLNDHLQLGYNTLYFNVTVSCVLVVVIFWHFHCSKLIFELFYSRLKFHIFFFMWINNLIKLSLTT